MSFRKNSASLGSSMINEVMVQGKSIFQLPVMDTVLLAGVGIVYLVLGGMVYRKCERKAMEMGVLGQY